MKGILFLGVVLVIAIVAWSYLQKEGFQDVPPEGASPGLTVPIVSPRRQTLTDGEVGAFAPLTAELLAPPPGQAASVNSRPFEDPAMEKAPAGRIKSIYETAVGFLGREAPGLSKLGDASVQLPLATARSDKNRLYDELNVLKKNPGLESSLTQEDLDGIEGNLAYLQKKWRQFKAAGGSPMPPEEGFLDLNGSKGRGWFAWLFGDGTAEGFQTGPDPAVAAAEAAAAVTAATAMKAAADSMKVAAEDAKNSMTSSQAAAAATLTAAQQAAAADTSNATKAAASADAQAKKTKIDTALAAANAWVTATTTFVTASATALTAANTWAGSAVTAANKTAYTTAASAATSAQANANAAKTTAEAAIGLTTAIAGTPSANQAATSDVTMDDINRLALKISIEVARLSKSQSQDLNTLARIDALNKVLAAVNDIKSEVASGRRKLQDVPFKKTDIDSFLPAMENPNTPLPDLIKEAGLKDVVNSLFPKFFTGDVEGTETARKMFNQYAETFFKNMSWDIKYSYKGQAEQDIAKNYADAMMNAKFASENNLNAVAAPAAGAAEGVSAPGATSLESQALTGAFGNILQNIVSDVSATGEGEEGAKGGKIQVTTNLGPGGTQRPGQAPLGPGGTEQQKEGFDWRARSKQICQQIAARGYKPTEFGCLENPDAEPYTGFSWRGYAKMVCNRLSTVYDPGVPELCGCPPQTWAGWKPLSL
jgi:hypothetical protein